MTKKAKEVTRQSGGTTRSAMKKARARKKRLLFPKLQMWIYYIVSLFYKDRGTIPPNIGNRILITNNLYITKAYMNSLVIVETLSEKTPIVFISDMVNYMRNKGSTAVVDVTFKNERCHIDLNDSGLTSRIRMWERSEKNNLLTEKEKRTAARCLYTVDEVKAGKQLVKTRTFITLRAKTGSELTKAEKILFKYLGSIDAKYRPVTSDVQRYLGYASLLSDKRDKQLKDVRAVIHSEETMAQMLPNSGSINDTKGLGLGVNIDNGSWFKINLEDITVARNLYICAPSGVGKTVLALNMCCTARECGWAVSVQDIKGNEFTNFIRGTGGYSISLRLNTSGYINSFVMHPEEVTDKEAVTYFNSRVNFSKKQISILSGFTERDAIMELEALLDEFLDAVYVSLGVLASNRNTWAATFQLNPFTIYDMLVEYMKPEICIRYPSIGKDLISKLRVTMSNRGSRSYIFREEFEYRKILEAPTIMFDYGLLDGAMSADDSVVFRLKFEYMLKLNADFVSYKYSHGMKTLAIMEESQVAKDDPRIMKGYVDAFTLRRAQGQTNVLLGNSVEAIRDSQLAKPLVENIKGILVGDLIPEAREVIINTFGLEEYRPAIERVGSSSFYSNSFVFINKMQEDAITPVLKVILKPGKKYKLLTPVKTKSTAII